MTGPEGGETKQAKERGEIFFVFECVGGSWVLYVEEPNGRSEKEEYVWEIWRFGGGVCAHFLRKHWSPCDQICTWPSPFFFSLTFSCLCYGFMPVFHLHQIDFQSSLGLSFLPLSFCDIYAGCLCCLLFVHYTFLFLTCFLQVLFMTHGLPFLHCFLFLSPI